MFIGSIRTNRSLTGFISKGLVEVHTLKDRHEQLAKEMSKRGYRHKSPLDVPDDLLYKAGNVDREANLRELARRCSACRELQEKHKSNNT